MGNISASLGRDVHADFARNRVALLAGNVVANVLVVVGALFAGDVLALLHIVANLVGHNLANLLRDIGALPTRDLLAVLTRLIPAFGGVLHSRGRNVN